MRCDVRYVRVLDPQKKGAAGKYLRKKECLLAGIAQSDLQKCSICRHNKF